jgi:hypothetical protein
MQQTPRVEVAVHGQNVAMVGRIQPKYDVLCQIVHSTSHQPRP